MNRQELLDLCLKAGFGDMGLRRDEEGNLRLITVYPYLFSQTHSDARISSYYFASQRSYRLLCGLAQKLCDMGIPARRDDSVPLKPLALQAGLGVLGRNSLVIHPRFGSQIVLGCLLLDTDMEIPEPQEIRRCEDCGLCRSACPAGALDRFAEVDLSRCLRLRMLSGQPYPVQQRELLGNRLLGCDDCQLCCPHNAGRTKPGSEAEPSLYALLSGDKATFQKLKADIGPNTARKKRILAQALLCAAEKNDPGIRPLVTPYLNDADETVREHAAWCLEKLRQKGL